MKPMHRVIFTFIAAIVLKNCFGQNINLNDLLAAVKANNKNTNNEENAPSQEQKTYSSTSVKTQEFGDLQSLIAAMKGGGNGNNVNLDIASLLSKQSAQQESNSNKNEKTIEISPNGETSLQSDGANTANNDKKNSKENTGGLNLGQLAALIKQQQQQQNGAASESKEQEVGQENASPPNNIASFLKKGDDDVTGSPGLQIETEGDNSKDGHSRFTLQRSPDGGLMLVPIKEQTGASRGLDMSELMKKPDNAVGGTNRQQLQLTSLVCPPKMHQISYFISFMNQSCL